MKSPFSWNLDFLMKFLRFHQNLNRISIVSWKLNCFMKSRFCIKFTLVHEISTFSWNLDSFMTSQFSHEIFTFSWNLKKFLKHIHVCIAVTLDPYRSTDSESIILDPCRSNDSGFILLGPGRARAQNSGESQNFGVIKKLSIKRDLSRTHRQTPRIHFRKP